MNTMCFSCYSVAAMFILMWRKISQLSNWLPSTLMNLTKKMHTLLLLCSTNVMLIRQIITQPRMAYQSAVAEVCLFYFYWTTFLKSLFFCCFNYIEVEFNLYYVVIVLCLHWKKKTDTEPIELVDWRLYSDGQLNAWFMLIVEHLKMGF